MKKRIEASSIKHFTCGPSLFKDSNPKPREKGNVQKFNKTGCLTVSCRVTSEVLVKNKQSSIGKELVRLVFL